MHNPWLDSYRTNPHLDRFQRDGKPSVESVNYPTEPTRLFKLVRNKSVTYFIQWRQKIVVESEGSSNVMNLSDARKLWLELKAQGWIQK